MAEQDFLPLQGFDHVEFYVGNAKQAAYFYSHAFGFTPLAYSGLETGVRDRASYVLAQGDIRFVFTTALQPDHPISEHVKLHGDGVKVVALTVDNARRSYEETTRRGATGVMEPRTIEDEFGKVTLASIATYGETIHTFVERQDYAGPFLPGYKPLPAAPESHARSAGLKAIDHIVGNVELGKMNEWVDFYARMLGFTQLIHFTDQAISTEYSALMSKVMQNGSGRIKFPINEPAQGKKKSQIEEYLDYYKTPGVQHIAMVTDDIIATVEQLKRQGVDFIPAIPSYYAEVEKRVGKIDEPMADIARLGILVDRDDEGYLLQIFTRNAQDRPTVFFEVIQRKGSRGFGEGNFKALFEAIEREQALRGNL
jgi:4-hydroxyphenylpyruvate dioxygenase